MSDLVSTFEGRETSQRTRAKGLATHCRQERESKSAAWRRLRLGIGVGVDFARSPFTSDIEEPASAWRKIHF